MMSLSRRKLIQVTSVILLLAATLAACSQVNQTPIMPGEPTPTTEPSLVLTPEPDSTPIPPDPTAAPDYLVPLDQLNGQKLIFAHPWTGETALLVDKLVDTFNQTNEWGIHIMVRRAGSSQALANLIEDGPFDAEYPQVVVAPSEHLVWWLENGNSVRPLNDLISDPIFGLDEQQRADFPLAFWQQDQSSGSQVGIPAQRDATVLFYNQTWAEELGFTQPPVNTNDFKEQACAAAFVNAHDRFAANDGTGGWIVNTDGLAAYSWLRSFGLENALDGESLKFQFNQPETEDALRFVRSMVDESCAWFSRTTASNEYFANRQALFYTGLLSDLALQAKTNTRLKSTDSWTVLPFPGSDRPVTVVNGLSYGILRSDLAAEVAGWIFVRWMSQPENAVQLLVTGGGLPVSASAVELAQAQMQETPQWAQTLQWIPTMQSPPPVAGWRIARFVLQDAFWQALQPFTVVDDIPLVLEQLDATILEVQAQQGQ